MRLIGFVITALGGHFRDGLSARGSPVPNTSTRHTRAGPKQMLQIRPTSAIFLK